jgi:sugar lactone lactonase YvrE
MPILSSATLRAAPSASIGNAMCYTFAAAAAATVNDEQGGQHFTQRLLSFALTCVVAALWTVTPAMAWDRGTVQSFAVLPEGAPKVEGLTVGEDGNVYVSTFDPTGPAPSQLFVFDDNGKLLRTMTIGGSSNATLGLGFNPITHQLLVIDFGAGKVLNVNPTTGASSVFMTVSGSAGLNALTFDQAGNVYVSDSFQGIIWTTGPSGGVGTIWKQDQLLTTTGTPPFGANGIAFNKARSIMFVANTGNDTLVQIAVNNVGGTLSAGAASVFTNSINGADGIVLDANDNIWVAANQADEIVVVDPTGKAIAKLGDFNGLKDGVTRGLLFPASPAFSKDGRSLFVTNLELDLTSIGLKQSVDSQWAAQVKRHSVARLLARIPPIVNVPPIASTD